MEQTTKRQLNLPERSDYVNVVTDIKENMENLDNAVPDTRTINGHTLDANVTITKSDVGLGNVDNTADADKPVSTATQTALNGKVPTTRKVNGHVLNADVTVTKGDVGLGNVDNTSDANKPVSTATQAALDGKVPTTRKVNGHALSADVTVSKSDVGLGNVDNLKQVPETRKVNGKVLSADITLYGSDIPMSSSDSTKLDNAITILDAAVKSDAKADSDYHLGFYRDVQGDLCEID